ncbi:hypothetical protein SUGI_0634120 [Cryptomeria japonica]|nr:hypothetical protein SUGI_0634120 [Cryptomeria japonica]
MAVPREEEASGREVGDAASARRLEALNTFKGYLKELKGLSNSLKAITEQMKTSHGSSHYDDLAQRRIELLKQERACFGNFERASVELERIYRETESFHAPSIVTGVQGLQEGQIASINQVKIKLAEMGRAFLREFVQEINEAKRIFQKTDTNIIFPSPCYSSYRGTRFILRSCGKSCGINSVFL